MLEFYGSRTQQNIEVLRFCRVAFGINASPFLLAATITHHLKKTGSKTAVEILRNIYVDNVVLTYDNVGLS